MGKPTLFWALVTILLSTACTKDELNPLERDTAASVPPTVELLSTVHMADPRAVAQLLKGFYYVEQGAWRWTKKDFSVVLKVPQSPSDRLVTLELRFAIPKVSMQRLSSLTLSATVNSMSVGAETFGKSGNYTFSKQIPSEAIKEKIARVEFQLDKAIAAGEMEARELGLVATSVALR